MLEYLYFKVDMISFKNEILNMIEGFDYTMAEYNCYNLGGKILYVDGFKDIIKIDDLEIKLKLRKGILKILGSELKIKDANIAQIIIVGNIYSCEVL